MPDVPSSTAPHGLLILIFLAGSVRIFLLLVLDQGRLPEIHRSASLHQEVRPARVPGLICSFSLVWAFLL
jgi:hypothetical protein